MKEKQQTTDGVKPVGKNKLELIRTCGKVHRPPLEIKCSHHRKEEADVPHGLPATANT